MTTERRTDDPQINIVTRSRALTGDDRVNEKKEYETTWVRNIAKKSSVFNI